MRDLYLELVEGKPQNNDIPYLRFHPTLPFAARPEEAEERFLAVYLSVMQAADKALHSGAS